MKVYILFILFFNYIASIQIPGNFNVYDSLSSYITPENDMLIYNPKNRTLFKYKYNSKSPFYPNMRILSTKEFPKDSSINISDIYFHFDYINSSSINITYFNEDYTSYYIYNPNTQNITYKHISLEVKEKNKLFLFLHPLNSSYGYPSINIVEFDFKNEEKIKIIKNYTIYSRKETINCYCSSASYENNIICGLIEFGTFYNKSSIQLFSSRFIYNLIYFSESTPFPKNVTIVNQTFFWMSEKDVKTGIFNDNFIKFIPLSEEKTIFCFDENNDNKDNEAFILKTRIKCGLAQVQNNNITINSLIYISNSTHRYSSEIYLGKNILDGVKISDKQVILSYYEFEKISSSFYHYNYEYYNKIHYAKITII